MTNEEILKKAIEKAKANGYIVLPLESQVLTFNIGTQYGKNNSITLWRNGWIMSHDFAQAFWGQQKHDRKGNYNCVYCDVEIIPYEREEGTEFCWQFQLTQMVLEEEPLRYLERFLND